MTLEEAKKLEPDDRIHGIRSRDPFLAGQWYKGEVIRRTEHGVVIRTNNPEDPPDGDLHSLSDPRLVDAHSLGPWNFEPLLDCFASKRFYRATSAPLPISTPAASSPFQSNPS
jgi:hypothetical protein